MQDSAIRGIPWTLLSYAANKLLTLGTTVVLARLLTPKDFGLIALAALAIMVLGLVRDLGVGSALVQRYDLSRRALGTGLTLIIGSGVVVAAFVAATAPLTAKLFEEPRLAGVLAALSATIVLGGVNWFHEALMQREMMFRRRFVAMTVQNVVLPPVAIVLAIEGAGVWSLVIGQIAGMVVAGVVFVALVPYRVAPRWDSADARDLMSTGKGYLLQGALAVVQQNADYVAVGRVLGAAQLGFYSMAYRFGELPYMAIADPVARVTFPAFARLRGEGQDVVAPFLTALRFVALVTCPIGVVASGVAEPFVEAVLGDKWLPMIGPLAVMGVWAAVRTIQTTIAWLLNSVGEPTLMGIVSAVVLVPLIPGLMLAAHHGGITAVAWVMLADMTLSLAVLAFFAQRRAGASISRQWRALRPVLIASPVAWAASRAVAVAGDAWPSGVTLIAGAAAGLAAYVAAVWLADRGILGEAVRQARRMANREPAPAAT